MDGFYDSKRFKHSKCQTPFRKSMTLKDFIVQNSDVLKSKGIVFNDFEFENIPKSFHKTGNIISFSLKPSLVDRKYDIGKIFNLMFNDVETVILNSGISGTFRKPVSEVVFSLSDPPNVECFHKENGCIFHFDALNLMFSKGNLEEKRRMSKLGSGEVIVDMFAGIGYFSIPMAVHSKPEKIFSIEKNPKSFNYLVKNIEVNNVYEIVFPIRGDCMIETPKNVADRVLMGYVGITHHYLIPAISSLKKEGGVIHYHETCPSSLFPKRPIDRIENAAKILNKKVIIQDFRVIKKHSPGVLHIVVDAFVF